MKRIQAAIVHDSHGLRSGRITQPQPAVVTPTCRVQLAAALPTAAARQPVHDPSSDGS